mgnify:CR=1 FL=1
MSEERKCVDALRKIVGRTQFATYLAAVTDVSEQEAVCTVKRVLDDMEITDVKLNAAITNNEGIVIRPEKDSYVLVTSIDGMNWFVSQWSKIEKISIDCTDKIVINGGDNAGIIKINELTQKLNELVDKFNAHTHTVPNGTSSLTSTQASAFNKSDYEDTKITH